MKTKRNETPLLAIYGRLNSTNRASKQGRPRRPAESEFRSCRPFGQLGGGGWMHMHALLLLTSHRTHISGVARPTLSPAPAPNRPGRSRAPVRPHHMNEWMPSCVWCLPHHATQSHLFFELAQFTVKFPSQMSSLSVLFFRQKKKTTKNLSV